jgi:hypothetical protein
MVRSSRTVKESSSKRHRLTTPAVKLIKYRADPDLPCPTAHCGESSEGLARPSKAVGFRRRARPRIPKQMILIMEGSRPVLCKYGFRSALLCSDHSRATPMAVTWIRWKLLSGRGARPRREEFASTLVRLFNSVTHYIPDFRLARPY